jgi:hypothetical protein
MGGRLKGDKQSMRGRLIYRAFTEDEGKAIASTMRALDMAIAVFHRRAQSQVLRKVA